MKVKNEEPFECPNCAEPISAAAVVCPYCQCGVSKEQFVACAFCGESIRRKATICRYCNKKTVGSKGADPISQVLKMLNPEPVSKNDDDSSVAFRANMALIMQRTMVIVESVEEYVSKHDHSVESQQIIRGIIRQTVNQDPAPLTMMEKGILLQSVLDEVFGFGPLGPVLRDPTVDTICVNSPKDIWVARHGKFEKTTIRFNDDAHLKKVINLMTEPLGLKLDESNPVINTVMPHGAHVNITLSCTGPTITIRSFGVPVLNLQAYTERDAMSFGMQNILKSCVQAHVNMLIFGLAGSGKTTMMNSLLTHMQPERRLISIEEKNELRLSFDNWVRLTPRAATPETPGEMTASSLIQAAIRMKPDRIVLGELRGAEAADLIASEQVARGFMTTLNAASAQECISRLETMLILSGLQEVAAQKLISTTVQLLVHVGKMPDGSHKVLEVSEVIGFLNGKPELRKMFALEESGTDTHGKIKWKHVGSDIKPVFWNNLQSSGVPVNPDWLL